MARKVLIVEDDPDIIMAVTQAMEAEGYEVAAAVDLSIAETLIKKGAPDIAIIDYQLPDGTGDQLARKLKATGDTPVIMYSARAQRSIVLKSIESGAVDYVLKGSGLSQLVERVKKHLDAA